MSGATILVVEDEHIVAMDIQSTLEGLGYSVPVTVGSGEGAIASAEKIRPDLVVMDIILSGLMDGIEAAAVIRSRFDIPVIFLTAYSDSITLQRAKMTQPYSYVVKPFTVQDLHTGVELALHNHATEVAERNKAAVSLLDAEQRFREIFNHSNDAIFVIDPEQSSILDVNPKACEMFGHPREELMSAGISAVYQDETPKLLGFAKSVFQRNESAATELSFITDVGELLYTELSGSVFALDGKNLVVAVVRDITERKELETKFLQSSQRSAKLAAVAWRAYSEIELAALRDAILDFFEDAGSGEKLASAATAARLVRIVASLEGKEEDPARRARIRELAATLEQRWIPPEAR